MEKNHPTWEQYNLYDIEILEKKILHIPDSLYEYYQTKIDKCIENNSILFKNLNCLFEASKKAKPIDFNLKTLYESIYTSKFDMILNEISSIEKITYKKTNKVLDSDKIIENINTIISNISKDPKVIMKYGINELKDYDIEMKEGVGFAEWWNKELSGNKKDLLIVYNNPDSLNKEIQRCS